MKRSRALERNSLGKWNWSPPTKKNSSVITISDSSDNSDSESETSSLVSTSSEGKDGDCMDRIGPNPLLIPILQCIILSNLDKSDLLNSRLVCQSWNTEILKICKKSNLRQNVDVDGLEKYVRHVKKKSRRFILPLQLTIVMTPVPKRKRLKSCDEIKFFSDLTTQVSYLITQFGPHCIAGLTLEYDGKKHGQKALRGLVNFLRTISFGLKKLDLSSFYIHSKNTTALNILKSSGLIFPNLKKLYTLESKSFGQSQIHGWMIERTPNLHELDIRQLQQNDKGPNPTVHTPLKLQTLKVLKFDEIDLKNFKNSSLPNLQKIRMSIIVTDMEIYREILSRVSQTLKSLTISLHLDLVPDVKLIDLPLLPHLEKFRIKLISDGGDTQIFEDFNNCLAECFPKLKSIDIPIGYLFEEWSLEFVTHLTIRVNDNQFIPILYKHTTLSHEVSYSELIHVKPKKHSHRNKNERISMKRNIENVMRKFPNVSTVSIVNECYEHPKNMNLTLIEFLHYISTHQNNVDTFQIRNYNQDYLSQVFRDVHLVKPPRIILENFNNITPKLESAIMNLFQQFTEGQGQEDQAESQQLDDYVEFTKYENVPRHLSGLKPQPPPVSHILKNIKRIRLEGCSKKYFNNSQDRLGYTTSFSHMTARPCLSLIAKHFPQVFQLELSQEMIDPQNVRLDIEYPNWTINLI